MAKRAALFLIGLIVLNVIAIIWETTNDGRLSKALDLFEGLTIVVFTIEYILRIWSITSYARYRHPVWGRIRWALTIPALIDLITILPFFVRATLALDLRYLRALRLLRLLKLARYTDAEETLGRVIWRQREELIASFILLVVLLVVAASSMYYVEYEAQPDKFSSIPAAMWWGAVTLTSVGYGDVYPITPVGKLLGGTMAVLGLGFFALPTGIIAAGFTEEMRSKRNGQAEKAKENHDNGLRTAGGPRLSSRTCSRCGAADKLNYRIRDDVWRKVTEPEFSGTAPGDRLCLACFDELAHLKHVDYAGAIRDITFVGEGMVCDLRMANAHFRTWTRVGVSLNE